MTLIVMLKCHQRHMQHLSVLRSLFIKYENAVFNGEQEKQFFIRVEMGLRNLSLEITNGDPWDRFFHIPASHS